MTGWELRLTQAALTKSSCQALFQTRHQFTQIQRDVYNGMGAVGTLAASQSLSHVVSPNVSWGGSQNLSFLTWGLM